MSQTEKGDIQQKTFSLQWTIEKFSSDCEKVGEIYTSPLFLIKYGDKTTRWYLKIYPRGINEEHKDYISLFLVNKSKNVPEIPMDFRLSIVLERNTSPRELGRSTHLTFTESINDWGWKMFVKRDIIEDTSNGALIDDSLTVSCKIRFGSKTKIPNMYDEWLDKMQKGFDEYEKLLDSSSFSDVTFNVKGKKIFLHKNILSCRNSVFQAMFEHEMKENKESVVEITDIDYDVMKELFRFIYSGKVENIDKIAKDLLIAADKYSVTDLKAMCEKTLYDDLSVDNAIEYLKLADMCDTLHLKKLVIQFFVDNMKDIEPKCDFKLLFAELDRDVISKIMRALAEKD